jgi:endonuclease/exonuclease/phosphatase (EEP) superfamily protein YafD
MKDPALRTMGMKVFSRQACVRLGVAGLWAVMGCWLLGYLGKWWWFFDLLSHFRLQAIAAFAVLALWLVVFGKRRHALVAGAVLVVAAVPVAPYWMPVKLTGAGPGLTLFSYNVLASNSNKNGVLKMIRESDADVVALYEVDAAWVAALEELADVYPERRYDARQDNFGNALLSKVKLDEVEVIRSPTSDLPSLVVGISEPGLECRLICTHPVPPMGAELARLRDGQLRELAERVRHEGRDDVVLAGDFNATPWSAEMGQFREAGLRDARLGYGLSPTWMRKLPWFAIPIDHVLVGPGIEVLEAKVLPATGSDHNPVFVRLRNLRK